MENDKAFVADIKKFIVAKAQERFGYAGLAEGDGLAMINTGDGNVIIKITWEV